MKAFPKGTRTMDINVKVGDRFIVVNPDMCEGYKEGDIATLASTTHYEGEDFNIEGRKHFICWNELAPLTRDLDHLQEGDVLVHVQGHEQMVLGICGKVIFISSTDFEYHKGGFTAAELKAAGYTLKEATPATTELTVAEVAQKLGYKPGELRIKE